MPWSLLTMVFAGAFSTIAHGVVISQGSNTPNLRVPGNDPGWNNVGVMGNGTAVYLGNRWVITANHIGLGNWQRSDGQVFDMSVGSAVTLQNPGTGLGLSDLRLVRLAEDPGLPSPIIATTPSLPGATVTMIGAGLVRSPTIQGWSLTPTASGPIWNDAPLPIAGATGYALTENRQMQWGTNEVASGLTFDFAQRTFVSTTSFDRQGQIFEAQATAGDSGGGVFEQRSDGDWYLSGIIIATKPIINQPENTVVFGDQTIFAGLAAYTSQIKDLLATPDRPWQNQFNQFDVSGSGKVDPRDVLVLINELLRTSERTLTGLPGANDALVDTNGDGRLSSADVLRVINAILSGNANPVLIPPSGLLSANSSFSHQVPEPSTFVLAGGGAALMTLLAAAKRRICRRATER